MVFDRAALNWQRGGDGNEKEADGERGCHGADDSGGDGSPMSYTDTHREMGRVLRVSAYLFSHKRYFKN